MSSPRPITLSELVDIPINDTFTLRQGCAPNLPSAEYELKRNGFDYPNSGEFVFQSGDEQCGLCPFNYGNDCGNSGLAGHRGGVKRIAYLGDQTRCCIANIGGQNTSKIDTITNTTCKPNDYTNPGSSYCSNTYTDYCAGSNIVDNPECKKLSTSNAAVYNKLMTDYCNTDDSNASNTQCIDWCQNNSSSCTQLNNITNCQKYGISGDTCSPQAIIDIKTKCQNYGMLSEQGLPVGTYPCTGDGLIEFEKDCKKYNITLSKCNANKLDAALTASLAQKLASDAQKQSDTQYRATQAVLGQIVDLPNSTPTKPNNMFLIIAIIILTLCMLLSSSGVASYLAFNQ
jgi:hypothetical protein